MVEILQKALNIIHTVKQKAFIQRVKKHDTYFTVHVLWERNLKIQISATVRYKVCNVIHVLST